MSSPLPAEQPDTPLSVFALKIALLSEQPLPAGVAVTEIFAD
jgi:hypothetical protein